MLRISSKPGLAAGGFAHGPVRVTERTWTSVDTADPAVREVLLAYVPTHLRIAGGQEAELAAAGLALRDARLVDLRVIEKKAALATKKPTT